MLFEAIIQFVIIVFCISRFFHIFNLKDKGADRKIIGKHVMAMAFVLIVLNTLISQWFFVAMWASLMIFIFVHQLLTDNSQ